MTMGSVNGGEPIKSVEDLVLNKNIQYGCKNGGSTLQFFKDSDSSIYQEMYSFMMTHQTLLTNSNEEGVTRVLAEHGKYAYLSESTLIDFVTQRNCDLVEVGRPLDNKGYGIAMPKSKKFSNFLS